MSPSRKAAKAVVSAIDYADPNTVLDGLSRLFGKRWTRSGKMTKHMPDRVDIINRTLCDDAIKYIAPSLEPYKGCTIIDIHPGACVWSNSLHEYLQPKKHILMEPETKYVDTFIQPLLSKPGSTYQHTTLSGAHPRSYWENYQTIFDSEKFLGPRPTVATDDPKLRELDTNVLITGNLARRYADVNQLPNMVPFVHLILQHLTWAALTNTVVHQTGLLRMLFWIPEKFKEQVLPPLSTRKSGFNVGLSMGAALHEVAGVEPGYQLYLERVSPLYEKPSILAAGTLTVAERMDQDGTRPPQGASLLRYSTEPRAKIPKSFLNAPEESLEDFKKAVQGFEDRMEDVMEIWKDAFESTPTVKLEAKKKILGELVPSVEYPQCMDVENNVRINTRSYKVVVDLDLFCRLINLEVRFCALMERGVDVGSFKERLFSHDERLRDYVLRYRKVGMAQIDDNLEDQIAFFARPQALPWNRRRFEPLQAKADDFWKNHPLSLLDITPVTGRDLSVPGLASHREAAMTCQQLIKYLLQAKTAPLSATLDNIAPGAARDLIPMVPEITDPRKGGRLNPARVRTRMLTEDMLVGLVKAWYLWPFRPTKGELESATYSFNAIDSDEYTRTMAFSDEVDEEH